MLQVDRNNCITVGVRGTFRPIGVHHTSPTDIDAIVAHIAAQQKPVAIHFHGGLVNEDHGMQTAAAVTSAYAAAGCHAVSVVWETGFFETVSRNIASIYRTELFHEIVKIVLRQAARRVGLEVGARGAGKPVSSEEIEAEMLKPAPFEETMLSTAAARGGAVVEEPTDEVERKVIEDLIEEDIREDLTDNRKIPNLLERHEEVEPLEPSLRATIEAHAEGARGVPLWLLKPLATTTYRVVARYWRSREHGFYPTVVEEILRELYLASAGHWIWASMKNAARDMFGPNGDLRGFDLHVGRYFIERMAGVKLPISLVGHSAGSIAICELLSAATRDGLSLHARNVVFLAPAASSEQFYAEVVSRPERFDRFRMLTMEDAYESKDILVPYVYPRSLLYLVSGIMESKPDTPICGMQRFMSGLKPYDDPTLVAIREFLQKDNRLVLSKTAETAAEGLRSSAVKHGGFNEDQLTRESVQTVLRG